IRSSARPTTVWLAWQSHQTRITLSRPFMVESASLSFIHSIVMTDGDLIERTRSALETVNDTPWLPDLTGELVRAGWRNIFREAGLTPFDYGTSRAIAKSVLVPRNVVGRL